MGKISFYYTAVLVTARFVMHLHKMCLGGFRCLECCFALFWGDGVDWEKVSCVAVVTAELDPALAVSGEREDLRLYRDLETACCCHSDDLQSAHWEQRLISVAVPWTRPHALYKPRRVRTKQLRPYYLYSDGWDSKCVLLTQLRLKQTWRACLNMR